VSVTETPPVGCGVSVTPRRCQQCGARLTRKIRRKSFGGITWTQQYRKGARFCCNACRQKAYRARIGGSS
jgi:hypothetical protein